MPINLCLPSFLFYILLMKNSFLVVWAHTHVHEFTLVHQDFRGSLCLNVIIKELFIFSPKDESEMVM